MPAFSHRWFLVVGSLVLASVMFAIIESDSASSSSSERTPLHRQLSYFDPRSTQFKPPPTSYNTNINNIRGNNVSNNLSRNSNYNNNNANKPPPVSYPPGTRHILSLGGSTTWGSKLEDREKAYPYLLPSMLGDVGNFVVHNLAVRATDASYACQCIQTMVVEGCGGRDDLEMDLILLEYSLNGLDGMDLLLKRLRRRYPEAQIVYVHLWSLRMNVDNAITGEKPRDELSKGLKFVQADANINAMLDDPNAKWKWGAAMVHDSKAIADRARQELEAVRGYIFQVPVPDDPAQAFPWFGPDYHHLSEYGHQNVAMAIVNLLQDVQPVQPNPDVSPGWGDGDKCLSWYETGHHNEVQIEGGTMKMFVKPDKWAVNVGKNFGQPAKFTFSSPANEMPVMLMIMSWGPGVYPKTETLLQSPNYPTQELIVDPLHPNPLNHVFHVTRTVHIGWANEGQSVLTVNPIEEQQRPLRVIGIVMCAACVEMDGGYIGDGDGSTHQRLGGTVPKPLALDSGAATVETTPSHLSSGSSSSSLFGGLNYNREEQQVESPVAPAQFGSGSAQAEETADSYKRQPTSLWSSPNDENQRDPNADKDAGSPRSVDAERTNSQSLFGSSSAAGTSENNQNGGDQQVQPVPSLFGSFPDSGEDEEEAQVNDSASAGAAGPDLTEEEEEELRNTESDWEPRNQFVDSNTKEKHQASFFATFGGGGAAIGNTELLDSPNEEQQQPERVSSFDPKNPVYADVQQDKFLSRLSSEDPTAVGSREPETLIQAQQQQQQQEETQLDEQAGFQQGFAPQQQQPPIASTNMLGQQQQPPQQFTFAEQPQQQQPPPSQYGNQNQLAVQQQPYNSAGMNPPQVYDQLPQQQQVPFNGMNPQQAPPPPPEQQFLGQASPQQQQSPPVPQYVNAMQQQQKWEQQQQPNFGFGGDGHQEEPRFQAGGDDEPVAPHYERHSSHLRLKDHRQSFPADGVQRHR